MCDGTGGLEFGRRVLSESDLKSQNRDFYELHWFSAGSAAFGTVCNDVCNRPEVDPTFTE